MSEERDFEVLRRAVEDPRQVPFEPLLLARALLALDGRIAALETKKPVRRRKATVDVGPEAEPPPS